MRVTVEFDKRAINSTNKRIASAAKQAARDSINSKMVEARKETIDEVASETQLKKNIVKNRLNDQGKRKADRVILKKATRGHLTGVAQVYLRGIPFHQFAKKAPQSPVSARGKTYRNAFWQAKAGRTTKYVWVRGKNRKLLLPKFGLRNRLILKYNKKLLSPQAINDMRVRFNRSLQRKLDKIRA